MKIIDESVKTIQFGDLKLGDLCKDNNRCYMKIATVCLDTEEGKHYYNAVCLQTGGLYHLGAELLVDEIEYAELRIKFQRG